MSTLDFEFQYLDGLERILATLEEICSPYYEFDRYPDIEDKAAAILYFLILDHYLLDGNKRFAMFTTEIFLNKNGCGFSINQDEYVKLAVDIATPENRPTLKELQLKMREYIIPLDPFSTTLM